MLIAESIVVASCLLALAEIVVTSGAGALSSLAASTTAASAVPAAEDEMLSSPFRSTVTLAMSLVVLPRTRNIERSMA